MTDGVGLDLIRPLALIVVVRKWLLWIHYLRPPVAIYRATFAFIESSGVDDVEVPGGVGLGAIFVSWFLACTTFSDIG